MTTVTARDCQELGYCMKSVRPWFARHDLDFRAFVRDGIDAEKLLALDDEFARKAVEQAERREQADG